MRYRSIVALGLWALVGGTGVVQARAAPQRPPVSAIDALFKRYDSPSTPGCSVAVVEAGQVVLKKSYGMADPALGVPMTSRTTTWIPYSKTRLFAALAVAMLARDRKIGLDDPVRKFVPQVPPYAAAVTVRQLLHHRSGFADYGVLAGPGWELGDRMSEDEFFRIISRWGALNFQPGSAEMYSNTDYALLRILVERVSGGSLHEFLRARLFEPLEMGGTRVGFDQTGAVPNHALFHQSSADGFEKVLRYRISPVGRISVTTSLDDVIRFEGALRKGALGIPGLIELLKPGASPSGGDTGYAFGIYRRTHRGIPLIEYRGIGGYTYLVEVPGRDLAVATICNIYEGMRSFGPDIAALYAGGTADEEKPDRPVRRPPALPANAQAAPVRPDALRALTGEYGGEAANSGVVDVMLVADQLVFKPRGRDAVPPLKPLGNNVFETSFQGTTFLVWFERVGDDMVLSSWDVAANEPGGADLRRRTRWQPTEGDIAAYPGVYVGEKVDITLHVRGEGDRLLVAARGLLESQLAPGAGRDAFSFPADYSVRFERDRAGKVVALTLDAARVEGIRLIRQ